MASYRLLAGSLLVLALSPLTLTAVSPNGSCGGSNGYTCQGSNFGNSCSRNNQCGRDGSYYKLSQGCQPAYGYCAPRGSVSPDGSCGGIDGFTCMGSGFGSGCGSAGRCGSDAGYTGTGCQQQYGYCGQCTTSAQPSTVTSTISTTAILPSTISASTTITITSGITTTILVTTSSSVATATVTTTTTAPVTPVASLATTTVFTTVTSTSGTTTISTSSVDAVLMKRDLTTATAFAIPHLVRRASSASCGTVITTGTTTTTTVRTTSTLTAYSTTTRVSWAFTTVPSSTSTSISTVVSVYSTNTLTSTSTAFSTYPSITATITRSSTTTQIVAQSTSAVAQSGPVYIQQVQNKEVTHCFYQTNQRIINQQRVSDDSTDDYSAGREECANFCTQFQNAGNPNSQCQSFYVFRSATSPTAYQYTYCFLDANPYSSSKIYCDNPDVNTVYYAAYQRASV